MPFLTDKVMEGENVRLRHVQVDDAEAILEAWQGHYVSWEKKSHTLGDGLRVLVAENLIKVATMILPHGIARFHGPSSNPKISSTWRHHKPRSLEEERRKLGSFEKDDDRYQYLIIRKASDEILGCIGLETNKKKDQDGNRRYGLDNHRVARLGMLLFREDPWDHACEQEAIKLLLDATFRQELVSSGGERFKLCEVIVRVNMHDEVTIGVLVDLGFQYSNIFMEYHGRETVIMEYLPKGLNVAEC